MIKSSLNFCKIFYNGSKSSSRLVQSGGNYLFNSRSYSSSNSRDQNDSHQKKQSGSYFNRYLIGGGIATAAILLGSGSVFMDDKVREPTLKESIITNYQNRIREFSTPEKIFTTFSSVEINGEKFMTADDFIRAILPHQHRAKKSKKIKNLPLSFKIADVDGDGLISFSEFLFFSTLLSIPANSASIAFKIMDVNGDNSIDANEFMNILKILQGQSQFAKNTTATTPKSNAVAQGWIDHLFGKSGNKKLTLEQFQQLLSQVRRDVLQLEFNFYDSQGTGFISQRDFALLLVSYSKLGNLENHVKIANTLPSTISDKNQGVSFEQFVQFNKLLDKLPDVELSMDLYQDMNQPFTKTQFKYISNIVAQFNPEPVVMDVIFSVFDTDKNGSLDKDEFVNILARRKYRGFQNQRDTGIVEKFKKVYKVLLGQD